MRTEKAEADKKIEKARGTSQATLIEAKAQAEANRLLSNSITDKLIRYKNADTWNGILPQFNGGSIIPMIDLKTK